MSGRPVPVAVLTGFLGAGKTTLLNALLARPELSRAAVVVNEFGQIGIDHLLVASIDSDLLVLTTGCICCTARGDLVAAMQDLLERRLAGRIAFDRIVIETTGMADPGPILAAMQLDPFLQVASRVDTVVTVVDAIAGAATLKAEPAARHQVVLADVLVLSKTDLGDADPAERVAIEGLLRRLNPHAAMLIGQDRDAVAAALVEPPLAIPDVRTVPVGSAHHHHDGVDATCLSTARVHPEVFEAFIGRLFGLAGGSVLRLKGLVASVDNPDRPILVQAVGTRLSPAERLPAWPSLDRGTRLVVIGRGLPQERVTQLWDAFFGPPAIDRPDAAGLMNGVSSTPGLF